MGLAKAVGAKAVTGLIGAAAKGLDDLFTSDEERGAQILEAARIRKDLALAQMQVNAAETQHRSVFVAGWRPFIGWVCGTAIAYHFIAQPLLAWILIGTGAVETPPPDLEIGQLLALLAAMLGSAGLRTYEKKTGLTR